VSFVTGGSSLGDDVMVCPLTWWQGVDVLASWPALPPPGGALGSTGRGCFLPLPLVAVPPINKHPRSAEDARWKTVPQTCPERNNKTKRNIPVERTWNVPEAIPGMPVQRFVPEMSLRLQMHSLR